MSAKGMIDLKFYLQLAGQPAIELQHSPDGWNDQFINRKRSIEKWGIETEYSIPVTFVKEGAKLLRQWVYAYGILADVSCIVYKRNRYTNQFLLAYSSKVEFSEMTDINKKRFTCRLIIGGLTQALINNMDTVYDIDVNNLNILEFEGLTANYETFIQDSADYSNSANWIIGPNMAPQQLRIEMDYTNFKNYNDGAITVMKSLTGNGWNIQVNRDCKLSISLAAFTRSWSISNASTPGNPSIVYIREQLLRHRGNTTTPLLTMSSYDMTITTGQTTTTAPDTYNGNIDVDCLAGDLYTVALTSNYISGDSCGFTITYNCSVGSISETVKIYAKLPQAHIPVISDYNLFAALGQKIYNCPVKSDVLTNSGLKYTSMNRYKQVKTTIKTSLKDFFQHHKSLSELGIGVEIIYNVETLVIEPITYWLDKNQPAVIVSGLSNVSIEMAKDLIPSKISVGYNSQSYGGEFGTKEFMGKHLLNVPQDHVKNELDYISPYRMDNTGMDYERKKYLDIINSSDNWTVDLDLGDDIFCFDSTFDHVTNGTYYFILNRNVVENITPSFSDQEKEDSFNLNYTPIRNLKRHSGYLKSCLKYFDGKELSQTSIEMFSQAVTNITGQATVFEGSPVPVNSLTGEYFAPFYLKFTAPVTNQFEAAYLQNNKILAKVMINGTWFTGYIMQMSKKLAGNRESDWVILLKNDNNLLKLI